MQDRGFHTGFGNVYFLGFETNLEFKPLKIQNAAKRAESTKCALSVYTGYAEWRSVVQTRNNRTLKKLQCKELRLGGLVTICLHVFRRSKSRSCQQIKELTDKCAETVFGFPRNDSNGAKVSLKPATAALRQRLRQKWEVGGGGQSLPRTGRAGPLRHSSLPPPSGGEGYSRPPRMLRVEPFNSARARSPLQQLLQTG